MFKKNKELIESIEALTAAVNRSNELQDNKIKALQTIANSVKSMKETICGEYGKHLHITIDNRY